MDEYGNEKFIYAFKTAQSFLIAVKLHVFTLHILTMGSLTISFMNYWKRIWVKFAKCNEYTGGICIVNVIVRVKL